MTTRRRSPAVSGTPVRATRGHCTSMLSLRPGVPRRRVKRRAHALSADRLTSSISQAALALAQVVSSSAVGRDDHFPARLQHMRHGLGHLSGWQGAGDGQPARTSCPRVFRAEQPERTEKRAGGHGGAGGDPPDFEIGRSQQVDADWLRPRHVPSRWCRRGASHPVAVRQQERLAEMDRPDQCREVGIPRRQAPATSRARRPRSVRATSASTLVAFVGCGGATQGRIRGCARRTARGRSWAARP